MKKFTTLGKAYGVAAAAEPLTSSGPLIFWTLFAVILAIISDNLLVESGKRYKH